MRVHVDVWARPRQSQNGQKVTDAEFVFVALDENGAPRPVFNDD
jgi:acyl-CoA thioesterase YciA